MGVVKLKARLVRLSPEVWRRLDELAREHGLLSGTQLIRLLVVKYLAEAAKGVEKGSTDDAHARGPRG